MINFKRTISIGLILVSMFNGICYADPEPVENAITQETETRAELEEKISKLDNEIETTLIEIEKLKENKKENQEKIKDLTEQGVKMKERKDSQDKAFGKRAAVLYKQGYYDDLSGKIFFYLNLVSINKEDDDIFDIINNIENIKKIIEYDTALLKDLETTLQNIEKNKIKVDNIKNQLQTQEKEIKEKYDELEKNKAELLLKLEEEILKEQTEAELQARTLEITFQSFQFEGQPSETSNEIANESYKYLGIPYLWGGTTTSGFDCSGFVQFLFRKYGVNLPRVSQDQQNVGMTVSISNIQPGDLVFFGNPAHHVGMYVGGGKYIHAPRTGDVIKISPLSGRAPSTIKRVM